MGTNSNKTPELSILQRVRRAHKQDALSVETRRWLLEKLPQAVPAIEAPPVRSVSVLGAAWWSGWRGVSSLSVGAAMAFCGALLVSEDAAFREQPDAFRKGRQSSHGVAAGSPPSRKGPAAPCSRTARGISCTALPWVLAI